MTQFTIQIKLTRISDTYGRSVGMGVDEPLTPGWWNANPPQVLGVVSGGITSPQTFSKTVYLEDGSHTIEAGVSAQSSTPWDLEIIVDGQSLIIGSSSGGVFVSTSFNVGESGVTQEMKPIDRLKMMFQKLRSFFVETESLRV